LKGKGEGGRSRKERREKCLDVHQIIDHQLVIAAHMDREKREGKKERGKSLIRKKERERMKTM